MVSPGKAANTMHTAEAPVTSASDYEKERGKPMPSLNHALIQAKIIGEFLSFPDYSVASELTLELPDHTWMTPDVSVYAHVRMDVNHDRIRMTLMPRMVVEIVSPGQGWQELVDKLDVYFTQGVESAWIVHPGTKIVAMYQSTTIPPQTVTSGEAKDPVTGLTARLEYIFA